MRIGNNPNKNVAVDNLSYTHQVVIPVYIPNEEGYFIDSLQIFRHCIDSLLNTVHTKTYITIVNNGSCKAVIEYLDNLYENNEIQEVLHAPNIGKVNAILKGLVGNTIELITIADADVLFLNNWQLETTKVFKTIPKAGVVGIVPQFNMFKVFCSNIIFDNLFNKNLKFIPVKNKEGLINFYKSIGWDDTYNKDLLKYSLGLELQNSKIYIGSGHFVATYKKQMFQEIKSHLNYKLGGDSVKYLDTIALRNDYWRVTTYDNYAYHMGNVYEPWMSNVVHNSNSEIISGFELQDKASRFTLFLKNRVFNKLLENKRFLKIFYRWKGLPKDMVQTYNDLVKK